MIFTQDTSSVLQTLNDGSSSSYDIELYKRVDMQVCCVHTWVYAEPSCTFLLCS